MVTLTLLLVLSSSGLLNQWLFWRTKELSLLVVATRSCRNEFITSWLYLCWDSIGRFYFGTVLEFWEVPIEALFEVAHRQLGHYLKEMSCSSGVQGYSPIALGLDCPEVSCWMLHRREVLWAWFSFKDKIHKRCWNQWGIVISGLTLASVFSWSCPIN